jgi:hypothetical protein
VGVFGRDLLQRGIAHIPRVLPVISPLLCRIGRAAGHKGQAKGSTPLSHFQKSSHLCVSFLPLNGEEAIVILW